MVKVVRCPAIAKQHIGNEVYGDWPLYGNPDERPVRIRRKRNHEQSQEDIDELRTLADDNDCTFEPEDL